MRPGRLAGNTKAVLGKYGFTASKRFGQNFITDVTVLEDIVKASHLKKNENVLEIGPGLGTLTEYLAEAAAKVYAVEVDKKLIPVLKETLDGYDNVEIINEDIMKVDVNSLMTDSPYRIVANLPYYITTPIIMTLLESHIPCRSITVMVQKEVGERMTAEPCNKSYGALTLAVEYYTAASIVREVPARCFIPEPKVDSVIVHMEVYDKPRVEVTDEGLLFSLIRGAFNQRRKTLVNALYGYSGLDMPKDRIKGAIARINVKPAVRGEELTLTQFALLANELAGEW